MKRELKCVHNKAINPEMGVVCDLRQPNSLCKNCKTFKSKYPSYCCQKRGENFEKGAKQHLNEALDFSDKEKLIAKIKEKGYLKYRDKLTMSPYIMAKWELDELVEEGVLKVTKKREGGFLFGKNYLIYELK